MKLDLCASGSLHGDAKVNLVRCVPHGIDSRAMSGSRERDRSQQSAAEVVAAHARLTSPLAEDGTTQWRQEPYSIDELLDEIALMLRDTQRFEREDPDHPAGAFMVAQMAGTLRDAERPPHPKQVGLGHYASLFAGWLIDRADRDTISDSYRAASLAASGSVQEPELARDLREFVAGVVSGAIDQDQFARRMQKPRAGRRRRRPTSPPRPDGLTLGDIKTTLSEMFSAAAVSTPLAAWTVFKQFVQIPVSAPLQYVVDEHDGDLVLFEWGVYQRPGSGDADEAFVVDLVRQLTVVDENDDYERMEQLRCSLSFDPTSELSELGTGTIWGDDDRERWFIEVEQSAGFEPIRSLRTPELRIEHDHI